MNKSHIYKIAKKYLINRGINFVEPIKLGRLTGSKQEVIFTDPLALDPNVAIVEPGVIRVLIDLNTEKAKLICDM